MQLHNEINFFFRVFATSTDASTLSSCGLARCLRVILPELKNTNEKKRSEQTQTLRAGCIVRWSQKFRPAANSLRRGAGRQKVNQLEVVIIYVQTQFGEDRCT